MALMRVRKSISEFKTIFRGLRLDSPTCIMRLIAIRISLIANSIMQLEFLELDFDFKSMILAYLLLSCRSFCEFNGADLSVSSSKMLLACLTIIIGFLGYPYCCSKMIINP